MENLTQRLIQSGLFFLKSGYFFDFQKRAGKASPHSSTEAQQYRGIHSSTEAQFYTG